MVTTAMETSSSSIHNDDHEEENKLVHLEVPVALCVCIVYVFVGLSIRYYKESYGSQPWIHESVISCIFGVLAGGVIVALTGQAMEFDDNLFFYLILPPIIFSAGYSLKRKKFFRYIHLITFFGVIATILNFLIISCGAYYYTHIFGLPGNHLKMTWYKALILGAVLTGSDEVAAISLVKMSEYPRMGALIFGEGVVNDALSIVLFKTFLPMFYAEEDVKHNNDDGDSYSVSTLSVFSTIVFQVACALGIGAFVGLTHARITRIMSFEKHPIQQTSLVLLFGYLAYTIAEGFGISGILTLFVAAVILAHYSWYSLSRSAQIASRLSFAAMSEIAEGFAFAYVGLSLWVYRSNAFNFGFAFYMIFIVLTARFASVLILFYTCKHCFKSFRIPIQEQIGFIMGGIVRGCLCWAQILQVHDQHVLKTTVLIIVMTTLICGGVVFPILLPMIVPPKQNTMTDTIIPGQGIKDELSIKLEEFRRGSGSNAGAPVAGYGYDSGNDSSDARPTPSTFMEGVPLLNTRSSIEIRKYGESSRRECTPSRRLSASRPRRESTVRNALDWLVISWIRFDETVMKPYFGGSTVSSQTKRAQLLGETKHRVSDATVSYIVDSEDDDLEIPDEEMKDMDLEEGDSNKSTPFESRKASVNKKSVANKLFSSVHK